MTLEDMDDERDEIIEETPAPEGSGNRTFFIVAGVLGGILLLALLCLALYTLVFAPQQRNQQATQAAEINAQNTQVAMAVTQTSQAARWTATPTATTTPSETVIYVVRAGDSLESIARQFGVTAEELLAVNQKPNITIQVGEQILIPNRGQIRVTPTQVLAAPTISASPTADRTATVAFLLTEAAAGRLTVTPTASGLPNTGFADDVGVPGMVGLALVLIVVIYLARRLRTAS
jgi:LPXTG-motif cell wall-anchored protein